MKSVYNWIIIIIFVIVFGYCVISHQRYTILQEEYNELLFEKSNVIDSLERINVQKMEFISNLELEIFDLNCKLDSLWSIKQDIIKDNKFTISNSITESSLILKSNLDEEDINNTI